MLIGPAVAGGNLRVNYFMTSMKVTKRKRVAPAVARSTARTAVNIELPIVETQPAKSVIAQEASVISSAIEVNAESSSTLIHALNASCTVRDSLALKSALLDLVIEPRPVTIDARAVERIDTAVLQVLCAFVRDRRAAGGAVLWVGATEGFCEAIRLLGLQQLLNVAAAQPSGR